MKSTLKVFICVLAIGLFASMNSLAQSNEGSLAGIVTDPTGNTVAGAVVTAANAANGQSFKSVTESDGQYRFPVLTIGDYRVTVVAKGFKTTTRSGVAVQIQSTSSLDIQLTIGEQTESVEVNSEAPQLQTESSDVGTVVTPDQVLDLPLSTNGAAIRNSQDFVFLTPATYGTGTSGGTFEGGVSGGQAFGSEILFDGASLQVESFGDGFANEILPSVEATGEFKVLIGGIPAQYGRTTGGVQSYSSKSGTNAWHGGGFDLLRRTALDANSWFNSGNPTPPDDKNNYGVLLGGPVRIPHVYDGRNKTFFFFTWEQFRQNQGYANLITLPTSANLTGDFSANLTSTILGNTCDVVKGTPSGIPIYQGEIFDPTTTYNGFLTDPTTLQTVATQCRNAYGSNSNPTNIIPLGEQSKVALAIASYFPQIPASAGIHNNYNWTGSFPIISTAETMRFDQAFGSNNNVFVSYSVRDNVRNNNNSDFPLPTTPFLTSQDLPTHLIRIGYDHIFSSNLLNHALIAFSRVLNSEAYTTASLGQNWSQKVGLPGGSGFLFPGIGLNEDSQSVGDSEPLSNQGYNSKISDNAYYVADSVVWQKGRHNIAIGGEYRNAPSFSGFTSMTNGDFSFDRAQTAGNSAQTTGSGNAVASFLTGQVQNVFSTNSLRSVKNVEQYVAIYVQDEYKVNRDLNLSLGLRYDVDLPFKETHNIGSQFDPNMLNTGSLGTGTKGALDFASKDGLSSRWVDVYYKNIEPRLGFSWTPEFLNHKTVISGSYNILNAGIFEWQQIYAGIPAGYSLTGQFNNNTNPFGASNLLDSTSAPSVTSNPGDYGVPTAGTAVNYDRSQLNGQNIPWNQRGFGRPGMYQTWGVNVQQQLATDLIFTLGYLGSHGTHLGSNLLSVNNLPISDFGQGLALENTITGGPYPTFSGTVAQSLRPFPQYQNINTAAFGENHGQLTYEALLGKLERRFHNGLNLLASYTWSKILTDTGNIIGGSLGGAYTANIQNPTNLRAEKAVSPQNTPQIFVVSYLYNLPFGKGKAFLNKSAAANYVVGGWSISGIQRYQSGQPNGFAGATGVPGFSNSIRWNLVPGQSVESAARKGGHFNPRTDKWYNPAAFTDPNTANLVASTGYHFGNKPAYEDDDRGFAYKEEDFGLIKRTPITEKIDFQFRAEFFNVFNRHVFGGPDGNPYDAGFGTVGGTNNSPRAGQLTFRVEF
jgi:hypothetical protein